MVTSCHIWRKIGFLDKNIGLVTALDLIKCLKTGQKQIFRLTCATVHKLPSNISTIFKWNINCLFSELVIHTASIGDSNSPPSTIICPRSSDPFYIVTYYITWVTTSSTHSITSFIGVEVASWCVYQTYDTKQYAIYLHVSSYISPILLYKVRTTKKIFFCGFPKCPFYQYYLK